VIDVWVGQQQAGTLFRPESDPLKFHFGYQLPCPLDAAVSLTMPVVREHYASDYKTLHPVFDMNLPEGALAERLHKEFSKVIANFDALALLKIVGQSQIGRLRFSMPGQLYADVEPESVRNLLALDGAQGLFESLLQRYAVHSGISGAQPKVMVRDVAHDLRHKEVSQTAPTHLTHRGATHIVKAWGSDYPRLAENEYFCMRAALHARLEVPDFALSKNGKFLIVKRFDLAHKRYLGFEDFCVLSGKTSSQKYDGSYEAVTKRIKDFVSHEHVRPALESFYKALVLSCALKNGDAHLKNFGVLYDHTESMVRLSPIYDLVTTTAYHSADILALSLGGTKRWPPAKALIAFGRVHCNLTESRAKALMRDTAQGMLFARHELQHHTERQAAFRTVGIKMLAQWDHGMQLSFSP
jgi:serine/threonine-protein kinase HipA